MNSYSNVNNIQDRLKPKRSVKKRKVFRPGRKLPALIAVFFIILLFASFFAHFQKLSVLQGEIREIESQLEELRAKNEELKEQLKQAQSDAYIEQVAREKLGLVKPGESRIVTSPQNNEE